MQKKYFRLSYIYLQEGTHIQAGQFTAVLLHSILRIPIPPPQPRASELFSLLSCVSIYKAAQSQEWAELPHAIPTLVINIQKADWSQEDLSAQPAVEKLDIQA